MTNTFYLTIVLLLITFGLYNTFTRKSKVSKFNLIFDIGIGLYLILFYFFDKYPIRWEWQKNLTRFPELLFGLYFIVKSFISIHLNKNKNENETIE